jgi:hypothetical protein
MADIRIIPAASVIGFTSSLNFSSSLTQAPSGSLVLNGSGSLGKTDLFAIEGGYGRLFEVSDDLSDTIFSVNTIAGIPVIEAFSDYTVKLGAYSPLGSTVNITSLPIESVSPHWKYGPAEVELFATKLPPSILISLVVCFK